MRLDILDSKVFNALDIEGIGMRPEVCHNVWKGKPEEQERNIPLDYP